MTSMKFAIVSIVRGLTVASALSLLACAAQKTEPEEPKYEVDNSEDETQPRGGVQMMQEFGGMNEEKVNATLKRLYPKLEECLMAGYERVEFLGGEVAFLIKVNLSGEAEHAHIERSTLGDYPTERCMIKHIQESRWPKPVGGKIGLARTSITFDPPADVRPPIEWSRSAITDSLVTAQDELGACGSGGPFEITAYVATSGNVMAAGVAHTDDEGDRAAECLVQKVEGLKFPSPGSWPAKVSFKR